MVRRGFFFWVPLPVLAAAGAVYMVAQIFRGLWYVGKRLWRYKIFQWALGAALGACFAVFLMAQLGY